MLIVASGKQWQREKSEEKGDSLYEEVQVCGKFKVKVILKYNLKCSYTAEALLLSKTFKLIFKSRFILIVSERLF